MTKFLGTEFLKSDEFFHFRDWPKWARLSFFKKHKDRKERFQLFLFFWANGMRPESALRWIMWHGTYDTSAWRSMEDLVNHTKTPKGVAYLNKFPVYDMNTNRVLRSNSV